MCVLINHPVKEMNSIARRGEPLLRQSVGLIDFSYVNKRHAAIIAED